MIKSHRQHAISIIRLRILTIRLAISIRQSTISIVHCILVQCFVVAIVVLRDMLNAANNNLAPRRPLFSNAIAVVDGRMLQKYIDRSILDFDVVYMLECVITHGFLNDYNLDNEFIITKIH